MDANLDATTSLASLLASSSTTTASPLITANALLALASNATPSSVVKTPSSAPASALISEEEELKLLNFPPRREDLSTAIPLTVIFALLLVTGCIGNLCTAIVIARPKNKYMHTATNYYLFSLAMSDFLFLILGLPQEMYTLWQRYPYVFGESFCIIRGYLSETSTYASILTISAFTVERYVAICHPLWAHTMSQLPRAITSILIIWMLAAIFAIPPAAGLGIITQKGPISNRTLEETAQCATKSTLYENMFVVSAIVFFIVPMIIVTVLYILIAFELRRSSKMNSAISKQTSSSQKGGAAPTATNYLSRWYHGAGAGKEPCRCCHRVKSRRQFALAAAWSRSQQQLSSMLSLSKQQQVNNNKEDIDKATSKNLMANLMGQRPSSAMGATTFTRRSPSPSVFSPTSTRSSSPSIRLKTGWSLGQNRSFWRKQQQRRQPHNQVVVEKEQRSQVQLHCVSMGDNECQIDVPEPAVATTVGSEQQQRSPLGYHGSLIQKSSSNERKCLLHDCHQINQCIHQHNHQSSKLHPLVAHQMSLTHSPSRQNSSSNLASAGNGNVSRKHHHHHHHHHQQHHNQQQIRRRSKSAASSKKSVVRMLGE